MPDTVTISPLQLLLDKENPRFLINTQTPTQDDIRNYLLQYEEIDSLASQINDYGGLMPGLRVIVFREAENEEYIVLEGNRRVCACQLLLNPTLISPENSFPTITERARANIQEIEVDIVSSRENAMAVLANRHIDDAKDWSPISKMRFFARLFSSGKSISEISKTTLIKERNILEDLRQYYLFEYCRNLSGWSSSEISILSDLHNIKVTKFTRIFGTKGASKKLKLSYNTITLQPTSRLPKNIFDAAVKKIVEATLLSDDANTRSTFSEIPGLIQLLESSDSIQTQQQVEQQPQQQQVEQQPQQQQVEQQPQQQQAEQQPQQQQVEQQPQQQQAEKQPQQQQAEQQPQQQQAEQQPQQQQVEQQPQQQQQLSFFRDLTWTAVTSTDPDNQGLITLAQEIKNLSICSGRSQHPPYKKYPVATTMLLRALLEQALKYNLKQIDQPTWNRLSRYSDPSLGQLLKHYRSNSNYRILLPDINIQRLFVSLFETNPGHHGCAIENFLNLTVHQANLITPDEIQLQSHAQRGLFQFIYHILNN